MWPVSRTIDRYDTTFDHDGLVSSAGLIVTATLMMRLGLEQLTTRWVRTGAPNAGRKICTLVAAMLAGATHIDHVDVVRAGATQAVLPFRVMAPSTIGTKIHGTTVFSSNAGHTRRCAHRLGGPVNRRGLGELPGRVDAARWSQL